MEGKRLFDDSWKQPARHPTVRHRGIECSSSCLVAFVKTEPTRFLLRQRFGRLPAAAVARIDKAAASEPDVRFIQVLTASSLDDMLDATAAVPPDKATRPRRAQPRAARPRPRA